jgi:hypothetical protein
MASFLQRLEAIVPRAWAPYYDKFAALFLLGLDAMEQAVLQGVYARLPGFPVDDLGNPREDALALHGRDRRIYRGPKEPALDYARRLVHWAETWATAGSVKTLLEQLYALGAPTYTTVRLVTASGVWYSLEASTGDFVMHTPSGTGFRLTKAGHLLAKPGHAHPWDWDSKSYDAAVYPTPADYAANKWSRFAIVVYAPNGVITHAEGVYGDGASVFGDAQGIDDFTEGTDALSSTVELYRTVIADFGPAGMTCEAVIIAFNPSSFNPLTPGPYPAPGMPDGHWGHHGKVDAGTQSDTGEAAWVPSRLPTARYWNGANLS